MAEEKPTVPIVEGEAPAQSKKGAKKAEAKAKKEAEKAKRAAEQKAAQEAAKAGAGGGEDLAKDNYGNKTQSVVPPTLSAEKVNLWNLGSEHEGKTIKLSAWLQNVRMQGAKMVFFELREESPWTIQGIMSVSPEGTPVSKQMVKWAGTLKLESFVCLEATVKKVPEPIKSCKVKNFELHVTKCFLIASSPEVLGMTYAVADRMVSNVEDVEAEKEAAAEESEFPTASLSTHLDNIVMHLRAPTQQAIMNVRDTVTQLFREYLYKNRFREFQPPYLIGAASEGGANVFSMPYFGKQAYLAQSPQFYKQFLIAGGRKRVFCVGPVFRAENSNTPRHMTEFTGLDLEMAIDESYTEVRDMMEGLLMFIFRELKERCAEDIAQIRSVYESEEFLLPEPGKEIRLTFAEGQKLLREEGPEEFRNVSDDEDMSTPQEKALGEVVRKKYKTDFYVLDKFPEGARPFYAAEDPENPKVTNAYDFFMRGQEILSGGQRIHIPDLLEDRIRKKGVDPESPGIKEYVNVFKSAGVPPHGGGGIGLDRVVAWYLKLPTVHLAAYFPRTPKRLGP